MTILGIYTDSRMQYVIIYSKGVQIQTSLHSQNSSLTGLGSMLVRITIYKILTVITPFSNVFAR